MSQVFQSNRLTAGNLIFPDTISVESDGVHYQKRRLFGSSEEVVNYRQIASVRANSGICCTTLIIETSGGSAPIVMNGLDKDAASAIRSSIKQMQAR